MVSSFWHFLRLAEQNRTEQNSGRFTQFLVNLGCNPAQSIGCPLALDSASLIYMVQARGTIIATSCSKLQRSSEMQVGPSAALVVLVRDC